MKLRTLIGVAALTSASFAHAGFMLDTNEWTIISAAGEDGYQSNGYVNPGYGGQAFDAEYLFYKVDGAELTIGLQTGFDINSGSQPYGDRDYYAGDIALSFDGSTSSYEYGIDFGFLTKGWYGSEMAAIDEGLYKVDSWNNDVYYNASHPYAIDTVDTDFGKKTIDVTSGDNKESGDEISYYRTATFNLAGLLESPSDPFTLDAHWTMSCGNDYIDGHADDVSVPEPESIALLALGLIGLGLARRRVAK